MRSWTSRGALAAALSCWLAVGVAAANEPVFPGKSWSVRTPVQAGLDAGKLNAFHELVGGRGCVVRGGYLVHTWGDAAQRGDVASACKPWFTHFLLLAIEQGTLKSVEDPVLPWEERLHDLNAGLAFKDRRIRWRHLACQTSCYGVEEPAGAAYDYSDYNMALFFDTLFLKVHKSTHARVDAEVLHPKLTDPLQCEDGPTFMAFGTGNRPGRLAISCRDFCRFGLLYLRQGNWNGKPLLAPASVRLAVTSPVANDVPRTQGKAAAMIAGQRSIGGGNNMTDHLGSYSYAWWINGVDREGKRHWPDAPLDAFGAFGHSGKRALVVIPGLDLVVSWNEAKIQSRDLENRALKLLVAAVVPAKDPAPCGERKLGVSVL
jgi:hypothetical protein